MVKIYTKFLSLIFLFSFILSSNSYSQIINEIKISGNQRIPEQTILMF